MIEHLAEENKKLAKALLETQKKLVICLQGLNAVLDYDHTGIVNKTLEELDKDEH